MRSFKLFSKSKNIMPSSSKKLSHKDKKRIVENVEDKLGLSDARPRLGGGPVMAALTAMAMIAVMVAGGIYIAGKDEMVVDPATNSYNKEIIHGNVEFASDYIYCDMYLNSNMTDIAIEIPYVYTENMPNMSVTSLSGSNAEDVSVQKVENSVLGSESTDSYNMGELKLQLNIPWSSGKEVIIDSFKVSIEGLGDNLLVQLGSPLRFHCVDAQTDENMQISLSSSVKDADTIQNTFRITATETRELSSIYMLTGEPLKCYERGSSSTLLSDYRISSGKALEFCNYITKGGNFTTESSAQLCYIYANALLEFTDNSGRVYNVIAGSDNSLFGKFAYPDTQLLKDAIVNDRTTFGNVSDFKMDSLAGNAYSQKVIEALETELSASEASHGSSVGDKYTKLTKDSVLCDGVTANIMILLEPGENYAVTPKEFALSTPDIKLYSSEQKEIDIDIRKAIYDRERDGVPIKYISISFNMNDLGDERNVTLKISMPNNELGTNLSLDQNISMNEYVSGDGESVYLSECAFYSSYETPTSAADGGESFTVADYSGETKTYSAKKFGLEYYETYNADSIEYNGKTYTKKGV